MLSCLRPFLPCGSQKDWESCRLDPTWRVQSLCSLGFLTANCYEYISRVCTCLLLLSSHRRQTVTYPLQCNGILLSTLKRCKLHQLGASSEKKNATGISSAQVLFLCMLLGLTQPIMDFTKTRPGDLETATVFARSAPHPWESRGNRRDLDAVGCKW